MSGFRMPKVGRLEKYKKGGVEAKEKKNISHAMAL